MNQAYVYGGIGGKPAFLVEAEQQARAARLRPEPGPEQPGRLRSWVQELREAARQLGRPHRRSGPVAPVS